MDKKLAQEIAEKVIDYFFSDETGKPIDRLMIVYGGQDFKNPGWGRESIRGEIVKQILKAAQQKMHPNKAVSNPHHIPCNYPFLQICRLEQVHATLF